VVVKNILVPQTAGNFSSSWVSVDFSGRILHHGVCYCVSVAKPEKLTGLKLVQIFPAFYGTRRSITAYTSALHLSLSQTRANQSMSPFHFLNIHFHIFSHLRLGLPSGLFTSGLPVAYPGIFFGGFNKFSWGQRTENGDLGAVAP